ncbi:MAG: VOC family protein [Candidatus Sumerlaeaceae bacterium]|nr:VOC family protein [Candidatus Sumerlaeaceae bacterium]
MTFPVGVAILRDIMLKSHPIVAFVATASPARAKEFYTEILGLKLVSEDPHALVFDAAGTTLRVAVVERVNPAGYTVLGWIVPDILDAVTNLLRRGVAFRHYEGLGQDELGIWIAPSRARIAWFHDPDGNTLSLTEHAKKEKAAKPAKAAPAKKPTTKAPAKKSAPKKPAKKPAKSKR